MFDSLPGGTAHAERAALFDGAARLVAGIASRSPVVVVLEDLHWADAGSIQMLRHLLAQPDAAAVMIVGTFRDSDIDRTHPLISLLADLRRDSRVTRIALEGLDLDAISELVEAVTGDRPDQVAASAIRTGTQGNPFFVQEIASHLADGGQLAPGRATTATDTAITVGDVDLALPDSVREVIGRRLGRLSAQSNRSLVTAAIIGREFDLSLLAAVTGHDPDELLDQLDEAVSARLVTEEQGTVGRFAFTHALTRAALVAELSETRRVRMHSRVAQAIAEHSPDDYVALAFHSAEAAPVSGVSAAVAHGRTATERAAATLAFEDVVVFGERTLGLTPADDDRTRVALLILIAVAQGTLGATDQSHHAAIAAVDIARRRAWTDEFVQAVDAYGLSGGFMVVDETLIGLADEVARILPAGDSATRVSVLANLSVWSSVGDPYASSSVESGEALAMARRLEDTTAIFHAATAHAFALTGWGRARERLELCDEALANEPEGSVWLAINPRLPRAVALLSMGDRAGFLQALDDLEDWATRHHHARMSTAAATGRAAIGGIEGRFDEAVEQLENALGHLSDPVAITSRVSFAMFMNAERGRFDRVLPMVEVLAGLENVPSARADLAACYAHMGRLPEAEEILKEFADAGWLTVPTNWARPATLASLVEACAMLGHAEYATTLLPLLEPYEGLLLVSYVGQSCRGAGASAIGQLYLALGDAGLAVASLEAAIAQEERVGGRSLAARSRYWLARALLLRNLDEDRGAAMQMASLVSAEAEAMKMDGLLAQARALLEQRPAI